MIKSKLLAIFTFTFLLLSSTESVYAASSPAYPTPMLTSDNPVKNIIEIALSQEGYHESADGEAIYSDWLNQTGHSWCSEFVAWSAYKAGISTDIIPSGTSVNKYRKFFSEKNTFFIVENGACAGCECHEYTSKTIKLSEIRPGDIAFIELDDDRTTGDDHTALVVSVGKDCINTIEGNTSDQVKQKVRSIEKIHGICRPDYSSVTYQGILPDKTSLTSVTAGKKDILKWKKSSLAEGYIIYRAKSKNGAYKKIKTVKDADTISCSIDNAKKKTYYYKICSYNTYADVMYGSKLSKAVINKK